MISPNSEVSMYLSLGPPRALRKRLNHFWTDVLEKVIFNVVLEERKQREVLQVQYKYEIEDKIFRSYGILKGARILNSTEVLDLLSNVMFGVEMSLIDMDKDLLYRLIIETRDSIIQKRVGGRLSKKEIEIERAMIISNVI